MIKNILLITYLILIFSNLFAKTTSGIVEETKKIYLEEFPDAWNPSIIKTDFGFLMTFRHCLAPVTPWVSYVGIVKLDDDFNPISTPVLLNTREDGDITPSQAEDARIFAFRNKLFVIYNDNREVVNPSLKQRRDMYIAELQETDEGFRLLTPLKITHSEKYHAVTWQKNWVPFEWNHELLLDYLRKPHEILNCDLSSGLSSPIFETTSKIKWDFGMIRGGTPALLVDGEYLAFFHSPIITKTSASNNVSMYHYYMGAYTFSSAPPFQITKISRSPIIGENFYTESSYDKRIIYPGGFTVGEKEFYVAYGKDDSEIWIATINKQKLMNSLKKIKQK